MWRGKEREAYGRAVTTAGTHSIGRLRAATVRNLDAWYAAFGVKPGDAMYLAPDKRVRIR